MTRSIRSRLPGTAFLGALVFLGFTATFEAAATKGWTSLKVAGSPPPGGAAHGSVYDAANNRLILLLPSNPAVPGRPPSQVWVLANANGLGGTPTWTQMATAGTPPVANSSSSAVYDPTSNRLIVYGGCFANCSPALSEVSVLSNANGIGGPPVWSQNVVSNPQVRVGHSAVYDPVNNLMIAFGGHLAFFGTDKNDTRILSNPDGASSPSTWTTPPTFGVLPPIRTSHSAVYDEANNRMIVMGGENLISTCCPYNIATMNDVWVLVHANGLTGTPTWVKLNPSGKLPPVRAWHSAVYDPAKNRLLVFGGYVWSNPSQSAIGMGDLWELQHANGSGGLPRWKQLGQVGTPPGANYFHVAGWDAAHGRMIVFGGQNRDTTSHSWLFVLQL